MSRGRRARTPRGAGRAGVEVLAGLGVLLLGAVVGFAVAGRGGPSGSEAGAAGRSGGAGAVGMAGMPGRPGSSASSRSRGVPVGEPNSVFFYAGPMFGTECAFSHAAPDDPIMYPRRPGLSHLHDFFGNPTADALSTYRTLRAAGATTCDIAEDTASYWAPALMRGTTPVAPLFADIYYRVAPGVRASSVRPYPPGLRMIAGDAFARAPLPTQIVGWGCGYAPEVTSTMPVCSTDRPLDLRVTFPDCWNGRQLDAADHKAHVAYSGRRGCPHGFPVALPQLTILVRYPVGADTAGLHPASGPPMTGHADFFNAWDPQALAENVTACLRRGVVCSVPASGRR